MIDVSIIGGLLGGISRLVPEALKFLDRNKERQHEKDMFNLQLTADAQKSREQLAAIDAQAASAQFTSSLDALKEAVKGQAVQTGIRIVDAINSLVRPGITYVVFSMWVTVKISALVLMHQQGGDLVHNLQLWWGESDQATLSYILNFWFMGRVFDKALR